ncbi:hypothetical protein H4R33_004465 [Dimargaris cristalligena]|uniref:phosphoglucomutase (alpha-D-glucose-1,6-bisphosphate-dependent) n=1 Tax=Dimargaris cristalligena TaxID=215637 RepID=A0A4P9ZMY3_9FUNG|nr:hypothetical protein H4R33_004465 [Dimargaris cristalligena]RKP34613.1 putative phosphoglucomutase [Dimargaris cristalligena]|eukprot:RKP34613.1 putative phosphoglucomutase [Dimargaris cristalligena]
MTASLDVRTVPTVVYDGQKPGTSGLRKRVKVFQQQHYTENFVQATLDAVSSDKGAKGSTLVVGGDGRYFLQDAIQKIIKIAAANQVAKLIIGRNGILSTPAASNLIRKHQADGGILLTASHNPGGPDNDFGIKFNVANGGPAPEAITDRIYESTKTIKFYRMVAMSDIDLSVIGSKRFGAHHPFEVEIVDSVNDYVALMRQIFDFALIRNFLQEHRENFTVLFDGMHGVTGPYGHALLVEELSLPSSSVMNGVTLPDFGGGHPDPNLTYAHELVARVRSERIAFGAASDGDGDRNMIISHDWFVTPSDSVAIIAAHADCIPYFKITGLRGLARSMPTSAAIDCVAKAKGVSLYEVPTGWKFFGNLMDAGQLSICGEESFGTGSDHIREKDGMWAILAWLNILASVSSQRGCLVSVRDLMREHFAQYGRNYFTRYDYEEVDSAAASQVMDLLQAQLASQQLIGTTQNGFTFAQMDNFCYEDPIDKSVSKNQGLRITFTDASRIIFRLSGTGSQGATIRIYIEKVEPANGQCDSDAQDVLKPLVQLALKISQLTELTGRTEPTVIT